MFKKKDPTVQKQCQHHKKLREQIKKTKLDALKDSRECDHRYVKKATENLTELYKTSEFSENHNFLLKQYIKLNSQTSLLQIVFIPTILTVMIDLAKSIFQEDGLPLLFNYLKEYIALQPYLDIVQNIIFCVAFLCFLLIFVLCILLIVKAFKWIIDLVSPSPESVIEQNELYIVKKLLFKHHILLD